MHNDEHKNFGETQDVLIVSAPQRACCGAKKKNPVVVGAQEKKMPQLSQHKQNSLPWWSQRKQLLWTTLDNSAFGANFSSAAQCYW